MPHDQRGTHRLHRFLLVLGSGLWFLASCATYSGIHASNVPPHSLHLKANPQDLVGLQRLMRHENLATTQRYVWYEPEDLAPRMAALEL